MGRATKPIISEKAAKKEVSKAKAGTSDSPGTRTTPRPRVLHGQTVKIRTGCGALYVTVNTLEGRFFELFIRGGKAGGCAASQCEAIGRLISLAWRNGIEPDDIVMQLKGISCQRPSKEEGEEILSCADAVAKAIEMAEALEREKESQDAVPKGQKTEREYQEVQK